TKANTTDANLQDDTTDEVIVGSAREIGRGFGVDAADIWRRYDNFNSSFTLRSDGSLLSSSDYASTQVVPTCTAASARCETVTAFYPATQLGGITRLINTPNFNRAYNGFEVNARRRMANHWMLNTSLAYNSIIQHYGDGSFQNPNNIAVRNGHEYDFATSGSGIGNVFVNAKWLFKLSGMYQLPYAFNVSAFYNARQGYPFEAAIQLPTALPNGGGTPTLILDPIGEHRLPDYQNLDPRLEPPTTCGSAL